MKKLFASAVIAVALLSAPAADARDRDGHRGGYHDRGYHHGHYKKHRHHNDRYRVVHHYYGPRYAYYYDDPYYGYRPYKYYPPRDSLFIGFGF